ncbi:hypothetical protein Val02_00640 [Virgisporangium aliadipatigenens]|uniref:HEAT repeat domain-containing protein n=1 Tax=Virgisporangium aliadipatigenens TaxID=741659 RepID=A0A8J3YFP4_9ACTN|nr:hypothetical protein [Virgisporangium aliadipatigenens]GIJ43178.1 hypothetical protein Val02_00640 [Virgisporangium aliadipatigenens]
MLDGLHDVDWASMQHAYGSAEEVPSLLTALRSPDPGERRKALDRFYGAVHHQGDISRCTTASLPFLFDLVHDPDTPDRASVLRLLVDIGREAVERRDSEYFRDIDEHDPETREYVDHNAAARLVCGRGAEFVGLAADADRMVRRAAVPALGLFLDGDPAGTTAVIRARFAAEYGVDERLLLVAAMADLALRDRSCVDGAVAWFDRLAADAEREPEVRIAALVHRARCVPERIDDDLVPTVVGLLWTVDGDRLPWPLPQPEPVTQEGVPPHVVEAFADLERHGRVHAHTTGLLTTFHRVLDSRVPQRTALLEAQLAHPDPGARVDAIRMGADLVRQWRGDHGVLIAAIGAQLGADHEVTAEAAGALDSCGALAEPARASLAARAVTAGPAAWAADDPHLRRAHQTTVRALARLGDVRAVPSLLVAFDRGVDEWRAVQVAGCLPDAADLFVPPLCALLARQDLTRDDLERGFGSPVYALGVLGDPRALPALADHLTAAVRHEAWDAVGWTLRALARFGPVASAVLPQVRRLIPAQEIRVRSAAASALWEIGRDADEALPPLLALLDEGMTDAAEALGRIGAPAAVALPRLREWLGREDRFGWKPVHGAAAIWEITGEPAAAPVLDALLRGWEANPVTARVSIGCLERMGSLAAPAVPRIRQELAERRRDHWTQPDEDEELLRRCRKVLAALS